LHWNHPIGPDRSIDNHGQPRHFPPFYNISRCFNVTKTVSTENKQALAIGEALCGARCRRAAKKLPTAASHIHEAMAHLLCDVLFPGTSHHLDRTSTRLRILHHIRGKLGPIRPFRQFLGVRRGFRTLELSSHLLLMAPTAVVG
jgi:hypothetical protein